MQLQVNQAIDMTYDSLIKLSLRHRPDVLIIGEIRDKETARAVIRASLTGVTVLSTIHAKSIAGVYERLLDLGVDKSELDNALQGIAYMRLIKGGGVIDFARENFQNHSSTNWNQQLEGLVKQGCLTERDIQGKKLKISQQVKVIQLFKQLLKAGFTLTEIVAFLERSHLLKEASLSLMKESLIRGDRLDQMLALVGVFGQYCYSDFSC